jgi:hypothetical protein
VEPTGYGGSQLAAPVDHASLSGHY